MTTDIYLDSNATNPVLAAAVDAARQAMEQDFGNPSSTH
jgi:cysteine sulfinate desulfinase/cysteine desulfurase-like protein